MRKSIFCAIDISISNKIAQLSVKKGYIHVQGYYIFYAHTWNVNFVCFTGFIQGKERHLYIEILFDLQTETVSYGNMKQDQINPSGG